MRPAIGRAGGGGAFAALAALGQGDAALRLGRLGGGGGDDGFGRFLAAGHVGVGVGLAEACLLYTSRCV